MGEAPAGRPAGGLRARLHAGFVEPVLFGLYLTGLAWLPLWYGSNDPIAWGANAVLFPGLAILYELSLLARGKGHPVGMRELALPASLFAAVVGWIALQTVGWRGGPLVNPVWSMAAEALGRPLAGSITADRELTDLALLRLITAAAAFWLSVQLCRDGARARLLLVAVASIGALYAAYGIVAAKAGQVPWLDIPPSGGKVTSTFVNHNSFGAYAGIALVAAAALILRHYQGELDGASGSRRHQLALLIEASGSGGAPMLAAGFVLLVGLLLTGSRGATIAAGTAMVALGFLMRHRDPERSRQSLGTIALGLGIVGAAVFAFGDTVGAALEARGVSDASRLAVYRLTLRSIFDVPLWGYGYGTVAAVFPMYRDRSLGVDGTWGQAHDTYLEVLQGLGLVFGPMLIACVALLVLRCIKGARRRRENAIVPQVAASAACLVGVHSLVDFSLQIQAVALTFVALLGAGVAQSESSRLVLED